MSYEIVQKVSNMKAQNIAKSFTSFTRYKLSMEQVSKCSTLIPLVLKVAGNLYLHFVLFE